MGGYTPLALPDSQATLLAGLATKQYLAQAGVGAGLGCGSGSKMAASAPIISSGTSQVRHLSYHPICIIRFTIGSTGGRQLLLENYDSRSMK